ncbi:hypothetical protein [Roseovarius amoyensis]|uniref:hypothetical protein n=1 Tax=Roseovarius amoyensis TaxID=2211448 RepID=UPI000DBE5216|nr:hypothetical protein [Roseovarius amoyensis]
MPNAFAYLMLMIWPVVCLLMFRRMGLERAIIWSILGGYLLLPPRATLDLPLVPDFDKTSIPNLCALLFCILIARRRVPVWPNTGMVRLLLVTFMAGTIATVLTNTDPIHFQSMFAAEPVSFVTHSLPGLRLIDVASVLSSQAITLIPFILGWSFLSSPAGTRELLLALVVGGLAYSVPALAEVRLSPQINTWVYGFFQHDFGQMMREGGFRPIVFLPHGLWIAFFFMTALLSASALGREAERGTRNRFMAAMLYLAFVLYLCKSLAPFLYGLALVPVLLLTSPRLQVRLALGFAVIAILYPILRDYDLVPIDRLLAWAEAIDPARAQSLGYRFENEEMLLERAHERWLFGWGVWGRNLVRDLQTGELISVPDGEWIIVFGTFGWVGYLSKMGLLAAPLYLLWRRLRHGTPSRVAAALALILAITLVDMLINAILTPYTWLIAGAVLGYCEREMPRAATPKEKRRGARPVLS